MIKQKTSIVIINYNGLRYLKKTISRIMSSYTNCEIIVVDNNSTDNSVKYLKKWEKIKIIKNNKNLGIGIGKNIGVKKAKGKYILLLDNDILLSSKNIIDDLINCYKKNTGFLQVLLKDIDKENTNHYGVYYSIYGMELLQKKYPIKNIICKKKPLKQIPACTGGIMFFSKENWQKIGGFDESQKFNLDDIDIGPRASIFGFKNYLYRANYFIHLGIKNEDKKEIFIKRMETHFSGVARMMLKNYKIKNMIIRFPVMCIFYFFKSIKYGFKKKSLLCFFAYFKSIKKFIKNLSDTLEQRKEIQKKRKTIDDDFLKFIIPKF